MKLTELTTTHFHKVLIYAPSGFGKTVAAANAPGKIEYWDTDHKISSAAAYYKTKKEVLEKIDVYQFMNLPVKERVPALEKRMALIDQARASGKPMHFDSLVLDSLTTFTEMIMEDYLVRSQLGIKVAVKDIPAMQHYQLLDKHLTQIISGLLALPANIIMLAHLDISKDEDTGTVTRQPLMKGKWAAKLPIYFEEVYVGKIGADGKRILQAIPDREYPNVRTQNGRPKEFPVEDLFKI